MTSSMHSLIRRGLLWLALALSLALAACGGGSSSEAGDCTLCGSTDTTTSTVADLRFTLSAQTIDNTSPADVTVTVTAVNAANQVISGASVLVTADNAGVVTTAASTTDTSGVLVATLGMGSNATARTITVTAASGSVTKTATIRVVDGSSSSPVTDLRFTLSAKTIANKSPEAVTVTVNAVNAANQTVSGASVLVSANNGGVVTTSASSTDSSGNLSATVGMGTDATARTITVTAVSGTVSKTTSINVVDSVSGGSASMTLGLSSTTVTANNPAVASVTLKDANGVVVPNVVVAFSTTGGLGAFSSNTALTNAQGVATVILSPVKSSTSGADYVQASATVNGTQLTQTAGFSITATNVGISSFTSDLGTAKLSAYGQANLTVNLSGVSSGTPVALSITSLCASKSKATITPASVTTSNATASFTYKDVQCGATDSADTVTVSVTGSAVTSTLSIPLSSPSASSLTFDSASPQVIYLKGSGFGETSTVTFVVRDQAGNALPNQSVDLVPVTLTGGVTMDGGTGQVTKLSDSDGKVTVRINSGTVPTPVRIRASLTNDASISTVSSNLSIAVGLPSQLNFSLAQGTINIEGMNYDGTTNTYTVIASDRLGNPVPAGTTINMITEGGQVQSQVFTTMTNGLASATATFQSSSPRPADGRITVLAYALGEESFLDTNGNNIWNAAEDFQDLGDVFLSRKFSDRYNTAQSDQYISLDKATGTTCVTPTSSLLSLDASMPSVGGATCDGAWGKNYVRRAVETVLSYSTSRPLWFRAGAGSLGGVSSGIRLDNGCSRLSIVTADDGWTTSSGTYFRLGSGNLYNAPVAGTLTFLMADANANRLNPMPAGTLISASATTGLTVTVGGSPVGSTSSATAASIAYKFDTTTASSGTVTLTTTTPKGTVTSYAFDLTMSSSPPSGTACSL